MPLTTLLKKITSTRQYLPVLLCCLSLAACGSGSTAVGTTPAAPVLAATPTPTPGPLTLPVVNSAPTASTVKVTDPNGGSAVVGDTLVGSYTYADVDGDAQGVSTFRWLRNGVAIAGEIAVNYPIVIADIGATISFEVTPVAATGVITGQATISPSGVIVTNVTNKITQFGITWTFDRNYTYGQTYGQFANGDYWVVGPVTITNISPRSTVDATGRTVNGSMINPSPRNGSVQGYDSSMYGTYGTAFNAVLNVVRPNQQNLTALNPLQVAVNSSLVSSVSSPTAGAMPQLKTVAILTVLATAPPTGSFRPDYSGIDKTIRFNKSQLNYFLLGKLPPVANTPTLAVVERYFEHPWLDHVPLWFNRFLHPSDNMPNYGRGMSDQIGIGALMLHLNFSNAAKETLLIRYVQMGIDNYGVAKNGGAHNWTPDGGHQSGRKWPILFAGLMLNDPAMQNIGAGDGTGTVEFGEDGQTFYVTQTDINLIHHPDRRSVAVQYTQADLGLPEWGIVHSVKPVGDNKAWTATYRNCCTANVWSGFVLAARIMHAQPLWAHQALFDYQDRYMNVSPVGSWLRSWTSFPAAMWDTYRVNY